MSRIASPPAGLTTAEAPFIEEARSQGPSRTAGQTWSVLRASNRATISDREHGETCGSETGYASGEVPFISEFTKPDDTEIYGAIVHSAPCRNATD